MKNKINLVSLHKSRISGASQCDEFKILSHCFAPSATKSKILSLCPSIAVIYAIISIISVASVSATSNITHQTTINPEFTINDSISVSLSSPNLVISDLTPGQSSDSNEITVTVSSNNVYGYTLKSTVGNAEDYNTDALVHTNGSNTGIFSNLTTTGTLSAGEWGYAYATYNPTTEAWNSYSSYAALPIYTNTGVGLIDESENGSTSIKFKIGAYATVNQVAGEYNNIVNFIATSNPEPTFCDLHTCMQDLTLASCAVNVGENSNPANIGDNITVYDKRTSNYASGDDASYTVRYINGGCWMTQNLRITGTISAEGSNFTGDDFNVSEYSLDSNDSSYTNHCDSTNGYNYACAKDSGSTTTGVWYNYYAASAGTIATDNNTAPATEDICPAGWHLPSGPSSIADTDFNKLVGNTAVGWQSPTTGLNAFDAVPGGKFLDGSLYGIQEGSWLSATVRTSTDRYGLFYNSNNNQFYGHNNYYRYFGVFIRCVRSS